LQFAGGGHFAKAAVFHHFGSCGDADKLIFQRTFGVRERGFMLLLLDCQLLELVHPEGASKLGGVLGEPA
jgi:hypothetical protein